MTGSWGGAPASMAKPLIRPNLRLLLRARLLIQTAEFILKAEPFHASSEEERNHLALGKGIGDRPGRNTNFSPLRDNVMYPAKPEFQPGTSSAPRRAADR